MGNESDGLDNGEVVLRVRCDEPEGSTVRAIKKVPLTVERLQYYYDRLEEFDVLFNELVKNDFRSWIQQFVAIRSDGSIEPTGLIWQVDDVGILYLTDIRPGLEALAHYTFWDRRLKGRERLIRKFAKYLFMKYDFHRIETEVAMYAPPALDAVERIGFTEEGRKREARLYQPKDADEPQWWDVKLFSLLESEV